MNPPSFASPSWPDHSSVTGEAPRATSGWNLRSLYFCGLAFLVGLLHPWTISLVGQLPIGELVILFLIGQTLLLTALTARLPALPSPRVLCFFAAVQVIALLSYVVSDLYRGSLPVDMIRGWSRMVFLLADMFGFAILLGADPRAFAWQQAGFGFSFIQVILVPPLFGDYWKFGFGFPLTALALMAVPYFSGRAAIAGTLATLVGLGGLHTAMGFRSAGGACWVIAALLALRYIPLRLRQGMMLAGMAAIVIASPHMVAHTFTSESARANRSNIERGAMLQAAWEAVSESPLIGQGSWFSKSNVTDNFVLIRRAAAQENRGSIGFDESDIEEVAIHSQILASLAEGGIFGGMFFICYGLGILWGIWHTLGAAPWSWLLPTRLFLFVTSFWDILMTPFSGPIRLNIALVAVLVCVCWSERRQSSVITAFRTSDTRESND